MELLDLAPLSPRAPKSALFLTFFQGSFQGIVRFTVCLVLLLLVDKSAWEDLCEKALENNFYVILVMGYSKVLSYHQERTNI